METLATRCKQEFTKDQIDVSRFSSLELSYLAATGKLQVIPGRLHKFQTALKAAGNVAPFHAESLLLSKVLKNGWIAVSKDLFTELKQVFTGSRPDLEAWARAQRLLPHMGKEFADSVREKVGAILDIVIAKSKITHQRMADDVLKKKAEITWDQWEKWLRLSTADLFEEFYSTYPERILAPQIAAIIDQYMSAVDQWTPKDIVDAFDLIVKFSEGDAHYWDNISSTETSFLWNAEAVFRADLNGIQTYQIVSMGDESVCEVCKLLAGMTVDVQTAKEQIQEMGSLTAEQLKEKYPFPRFAQIERLTVAELEAIPSTRLPPFHGRCRCALIYVGGPSEGARAACRET